MPYCFQWTAITFTHPTTMIIAHSINDFFNGGINGIAFLSNDRIVLEGLALVEQEVSHCLGFALQEFNQRPLEQKSHALPLHQADPLNPLLWGFIRDRGPVS